MSKDTGKTVGDVLISEYNQEYTRESVIITNPSANEETFAAGYPLNGATPILNAAITSITGILLTPCTLAAGATKKVAVLRRGPAVVNKSALPTVDYAGTNLTMATFQTELEAFNPPVVVRTEPTKSTET